MKHKTEFRQVFTYLNIAFNSKDEQAIKSRNDYYYIMIITK